MAKTLVSAFDDISSAQNVVNELRATGVSENHVRLMDSSSAAGDASWTEKIRNWFGALFEDAEHRATADDYSEALRRGHYLVVAHVDNDRVDDTQAIMNRYGAIDISERSAQWRNAGYTGTFDPNARPYTTEERARELEAYQQQTATEAYQQQTATEAIPVVQEELAIGTRVVQRGGVRIHSYIEEMPVEQLVRLREERINVERRPANRAIEQGDAAFQERTLEVEALGEEPIIEKRARVVEEVVVGKAVEEREQKVQETVRRKDVKVEQVPAEKTRSRPNAPTGPSPRHR